MTERWILRGARELSKQLSFLEFVQGAELKLLRK